ncbi:UNKNOWN [Stylonychia lemnae]|uniref:Uncharacterized protein n=1 Tax=Stylonychia lemnae TaxID=5949 RepID=A0A078A1X5_STYLE|nr:UNKNOWN [Stylonychia lemnae]|eukprot:CDW75478.1 UNKNOWN [Stylonychia lemnae]
MSNVTIANYSDPNYYDECFNATGQLCDYCCNILLQTCVRDIRACEPIYERGASNVYILLLFVGSVVCGCPLIIFCLKFLKLDQDSLFGGIAENNDAPEIDQGPPPQDVELVELKIKQSANPERNAQPFKKIEVTNLQDQERQPLTMENEQLHS